MKIPNSATRQPGALRLTASLMLSAGLLVCVGAAGAADTLDTALDIERTARSSVEVLPADRGVFDARHRVALSRLHAAT